MAGVPQDEEDPTKGARAFPHRRLGDQADAEVGIESDWTTGEEDGLEEAKKPRKRKARRQLGGHEALLLQTIYQELETGDVEKAGLLYGHLLQRKHNGRLIDVRYDNLWNLGAEILMREGEKPVEDHGPTESPTRPSHNQRWGHATNMPKVRAYYDALIQRFPYDPRNSHLTCAVDFWLALLNCEIYNAHAEHDRDLQCLSNPDSVELEEEPPAEAWDDMTTWRDAAIERKKDSIRKKTLMAMEGVAARMDEIMREPPYSKLNEFARTRGMLSLYIADLLIPSEKLAPSAELHNAHHKKMEEQDFAKVLLQKVLDNGGALGSETMLLLDPSGEGPENTGLFASLPIR